MNDILEFLKQSGDESEVFQFLKDKASGTTNAIGNRAKSTIKTNNRSLREPTIYNWKVVMTFGAIIAILIFSFFLYITPIVEARFPIDLFKEIYGIYLFLLFFNLVNAVYTVTYYHYRISTIGMKGPKGRTGKRGESGKNTSCKIDKKYTSTFVIDEKPIKREIKTKINLPPSIVQKDNKNEWRKMDGNLGIRHFIGGNGRRCLEKSSKIRCKLSDFTGPGENEQDIKEKQANNKTNENQPFNGVILDVNEKDNIIYSMQFFFDSKEHPSGEPDYILYDKRYGRQKTIGKVYTVLCPKNSAFHRIEAVVSEDRIEGTRLQDYGLLRGIAFQCRDITTGDLKPLRSSTGEYKNRVYFGKNPSPGEKRYKYVTSECGFVSSNDEQRKLKIPGFFSKLTMLSSPSAIHGFRMDQCSYYYYDPNQYY